jgi:hypothetical protein
VSSDVLGGPPDHLVAGGQRIYGETAGNRKNLFALPRAGGVPVALASGADDSRQIAVAGGELLFFTAGSFGGKSTLNAVATTGGPVRVITSGTYADGDLAVTGDRVVFSADRRVWSAPIHRGG